MSGESVMTTPKMGGPAIAAMNAPNEIVIVKAGDNIQDPMTLPVGEKFVPTMLSYLHSPEGSYYPISGVEGIRVEEGLLYRCTQQMTDGEGNTVQCPYTSQNLRSVIAHRAHHTRSGAVRSDRSGRPSHNAPPPEEVEKALSTLATYVRTTAARSTSATDWKERALKAERENAKIKKSLSALRGLLGEDQ